jgi:heptosyltransferase II
LIRKDSYLAASDFYMENRLIIKTGAAGDVVRTTSLLNVLEGNIYWVTANESKPLLPDDMDNLAILSVDEAFRLIKKIKFEEVISLEEDKDCAKLASEATAKKLTGIYSDNGRINYTDNSADWFDMSRISKFGLGKANQLKAENQFSYQYYIFKMLGKKFNGEPYKIFTDDAVKTISNLIGIEKRTGNQWPNKQWWGYNDLISKLEAEDHVVKVFKQRTDIRDYLRDISECSHIVSGDTLTMHIALAYKKTCTAIFNCTSPQEIYDYGLLKKVVSPLLRQCFYSSSLDREVIESVPVEDVYKLLPL